MNKETTLRIIAGGIIAILNLIKVIFKADFFVGDEVVYAIVDILYASFLAWKNNDFSTVSSTFTKIMRVAKECVKTGDLTLVDKITSAYKEWEDEHTV